MNKEPPVEVIKRLLKESELDCSDWDDETQLELATEIFTGLLRAGYDLNEPR